MIVRGKRIVKLFQILFSTTTKYRWINQRIEGRSLKDLSVLLIDKLVCDTFH